MNVVTTCSIKNAGRIEQEQKDLVRDMTTACLSVLACRGVMVSGKGEFELYSKIREHVQNSVQIQAELALIRERNGNNAA